MSECRHFKDAEHSYHLPLGPKGIDCCAPCYSHIMPEFDLAVFTMFNHAFVEQQVHDYDQAAWLLAEKDVEISELRATIELLEADEL